MQCVAFATVILIRRFVRNRLTDTYANETLFVVRRKPTGALLFDPMSRRWKWMSARLPERSQDIGYEPRTWSAQARAGEWTVVRADDRI